MSEFKQKAKRKRGFRNPYIFLASGIVIGIIVTALFGATFLFFGVNSVAVSNDLVVVSEATNVPTVTPLAPPAFASGAATAPVISAQGVEPTPIANRIQSAAISGDGQYLAYVSSETDGTRIYINNLRVSDSLYGNTYQLYQGFGNFNDIIFSPDGAYLIATIDSGFGMLFDVATRTLIEEYPQIGGAGFTSDSDFLVLVGRNTGIRVLNITSNPPTLAATRAIEGDAAYTIGAVAVSRDRQLAIGRDADIEIYNLNDLNAAPQILQPNNGFVSDLAFHPTQMVRLAVALSGNYPEGGTVQIYDLTNSSRSQYDFGTRVFALAFSNDGEWLAIGGGESGYAESRLIAFRWDSTNNPIPSDPAFYQPIEFEGHEHTIFDVAFTREGHLLSAGWDGSVRLWDLTAPDSELSVYRP